ASRRGAGGRGRGAGRRRAGPRARVRGRARTRARAGRDHRGVTRASRLLAPAERGAILAPVARRTGRKLLQFDRKLGARFVAGADEAGRGPLAGPLLVAGVLLDYAKLRDHKVRPLACLNDSKQCTEAQREELYRAVIGCAERVVVRAVPATQIDREGLHRSNLAGLRGVLAELAPPAEVCLVDGFRLGKEAPEHRAVVDGDEKSAAIAAASIV